MTILPKYDVYAIKYAEARRTVQECFLMPDPHDRAVEMDYFVWLIRGAGRTVLRLDADLRAVSRARRELDAILSGYRAATPEHIERRLAELREEYLD